MAQLILIASHTVNIVLCAIHVGLFFSEFIFGAAKPICDELANLSCEKVRTFQFARTMLDPLLLSFCARFSSS